MASSDDAPCTSPQCSSSFSECGCKKDRCANNRCKCRKAGLQCTDLCSCADNEEDDCCHNVPDEEENGDNEDDMEEYDDEVDEEVMDWEDTRPRAIAYGRVLSFILVTGIYNESQYYNGRGYCSLFVCNLTSKHYTECAHNPW